jgi:predicted dehydrogenase
VSIIQASWNWPFDRKNMEVYGETGYAITIARDNVRVRLPGENERGFEADSTAVSAPYDHPLTELRAVILDGVKPDALTSLETNLIATEILDAARTSAATGKTISLPLSK